MSELVEIQGRRLGKTEASAPHAMLRDFVDMERYEATTVIPANVVNSLDANGQPVVLAMYGNDKQGDCTIAGIGNILRVDSLDALEITDGDVEAAYVAVTGQEGAAYDPATGANDNGCNEVDVLDFWTGSGVGGNRLLGHAGVDYSSDREIRMALHLCGPLYPGWQLSTDQQTQPIWQPGRARPGSWGGHCAPIADYYTAIPAGLVVGGTPIPSGVYRRILSLMTWGGYRPCDGNYVNFACDELHALMTDAWLARNEANPAINVSALKTYFGTLTAER